MTSKPYAAIFDFELLPYSLGDVLTWNVQTAVRCIEAGRDRVDVYICLDDRYPASIYQRGLIVAENCGLHFNELFGAYGTHPLLGDIHIFHTRENLIERMRQVAKDDPVNTEVLDDYETVLGKRSDEAALNAYFIKYIYSHARLNAYHEERGGIPLLKGSGGCGPDVDALLTRVFADKRVVVIHPRLRRLDNGMGGDHTYFRDSDFLEWYDFARRVGEERPEVQFVVVGRLQEKPIELLRLPNVISLRSLGLGLGHELTLLRLADLFIGTSSGFAAMANFCEVPYFITRMNPESCNAYAIEQGAPKLPFATDNQLLIYESETADMLRGLLERGLSLPPRRSPAEAVKRTQGVDVHNFNADRQRWLQPAASTSRFFVDDAYADQETAFLVLPKIQAAAELLKAGDIEGAKAAAARIEAAFPRLADKYPELAALKARLPPPRNVKAEVKQSMRQRLMTVNQKVLPPVLRDTRVHFLARRLKQKLLSRMH
jgi:hypothetical protein